MYSQITANKRRTVLIMLVFLLFVGALAWLFGQYANSPGLTYGVLIGGAIYALIMYYSGSRLSLAVNGAQEIQKKGKPPVWRDQKNPAQNESLPPPAACITKDLLPQHL